MIRNLAACAVLAATATLASAQSDAPRLRDVVGDRFLIGAAFGRSVVDGGLPENVASRNLVAYHYNTATTENELKWYHLQPEPGPYRFEDADAFVEFCEKNNLYPVGHTLIWDLRTPDWVFKDVTRDQLIERMRTHIHTVVGRYKGRIKTWDVVNEAIDRKGQPHKHSPWQRIIGPEFIAMAFKFAHEADPDAKLYYNDNNLQLPRKRDATVKLVNELKAAGVPIHGIGDQGHYRLSTDFAEVEKSIIAFANTGLRLSFSEVDISALPEAWKYRDQDINDIIEYRDELNPYTKGLPPEVEMKMVNGYAELFRQFAKHADKIDRVTFWGVTDGGSWLNNRPIRGRTDYPLLFDRQAQPKKSFHAVVEVLSK
jgi:endo-1,4-beta-xylanase